MLTNRAWYCVEEGYDCSEIAEDLFNIANGKGMIFRIKLDVGEIKVKECDEIVSYLYHEIYCDDVFIYDPRFSRQPLVRMKYFRFLRQLNGNTSKINFQIIKRGGK